MLRIPFSFLFNVFLLVRTALPVIAQDNSVHFHLTYGKHNVGFKNYTRNDSTRSYIRLYDWDNVVRPRPISISVWYPSTKREAKSPLLVKDYLVILKQEEEWEDLPNEKILSWFYYADSPLHRKRMEIPTKSYASSTPVADKLPVIIYAPSYQASSVENFALCEFLASHGYVVLASPSRGTENRFLGGGTTKDMETQARDIEFLIQEASSLPFVDSHRLAVAGFSFGGISNVLAKMRNNRIKALVCLDGSIKYQPDKLFSSPYADLSRMDVPFLFMSQKDIPLQVMREDKIDTTLNTRFAFYDSLKYSEAYYLKFNHLTHSYFSSLGVLFQERDIRQDKSDQEILNSYQWVARYTLEFLNASLRGDEKARQFLTKDPEENGVAANVISKKYKKALTKSLSFEGFNLLARQQNYRNLPELYEKTKKNDSGLQLDEWKLNNLGFQLLIKGNLGEGIRVLTFNTLLFPQSGNAFDSLAEAYLMQDKKELAIQSFRKSLVLNPQNQNAINQLQKLEK